MTQRTTNLGKLEQVIHWGWHQATDRKEIRYIESGVTGEVIEYISFLLIYWSTHWLYFSNSASYIISAICGFTMHKYWSFKGDQKHKDSHQMITYAAMSTTNFFVSNALVGLFVYTVHIRPSYSKLLAIGITAIWSFLLSNYVIFKHKKIDA